MAPPTVRARGLRELSRDFGKIEKGLKKEIQKELSDVAGVVSSDARRWASQLYGESVGNKIRPRVRGASAYVESRARSKGVRPAFGAKVMRVILTSATKRQDEVVEALEGMLDRLVSKNGFGRGGIL